jgi:WbqC-like protein family
MENLQQGSEGLLAAIHQPNFFPWLGYFDKIRRADIFIILDSVDYPRSGSSGMGSWCNRVRIKVQGEARWITCPIRRLALGEPILAAEIDDTQPWRSRLLKTLEANYRRALNYPKAMTVLEPLIRGPETNLAAFNIAAITKIAAKLGLSTHLVRQSTLPHAGRATALLISLVKAVGSDAYLVGGGAAGYQKDEEFAAAGVKLVYQDFTPSPYGDPARFIPGLSVIDYLMHHDQPLSEAFPGLTP